MRQSLIILQILFDITSIKDALVNSNVRVDQEKRPGKCYISRDVFCLQVINVISPHYKLTTDTIHVLQVGLLANEHFDYIPGKL